MIAATTKPIYLLEAGYPSGLANNSSETKQADFVKKIFAEWDKYPSRIMAINFVWLHDLSDASVSGYQAYYGVNSAAFGSYLQTMGLRKYDGYLKPAFTTLDTEAGLRGWGPDSFAAPDLPQEPQLSVLSASNSVYTIQAVGAAGTSIIIQTSPDLIEWTSFSTNMIPAAGFVIITDPIISSQPNRFYRAMYANQLS